MSTEVNRPQPAPEFFKNVSEVIEFCVEPLLSRGSLVMLQGKPKSGKSSFVLFLAIALARGKWASGRLSVKKPGRCLFISFEDSRRRLLHRTLAYLKSFGDGVLPENLYFWDRPQLSLDNASAVKDLVNFIVEQKIDVVVIDPFIYSHSADENSSSAVQHVMANLRHIVDTTQCCLIFTHHVRKSGAGGDYSDTADRGRGSSAIAAAVDTILDWTPQRLLGRSVCSAVSKDWEPFRFSAFQATTTDGGMRWEITEVPGKANVEDAAAKVIRAVTTLAVQNPNGVTRGQVAEYLVWKSDTTAGTHLEALAKAGRLRRKQGARGAWLYLPPT